MTRTGRLLAIVVATLSLSTAAFANDYPNAPVTLIVPYPAGTGTDSFARIFARSLEARLGQRFVVDNKPGANGMNGSDVASRAKPDGYTLLFTTNSTHTSVQGLYRKVPYDPVKGFTPVSILYESSTMLVARSDLGVKNMAQLVAYAKANPGKLNIGTANASGQISVEILKRRAGVDITGVPYRGTPQALADLLGGNLQLMVGDIATVGQQVEAGQLNALAFFTLDRNPVYTSVETYNETVAPGVDLSFWAAIFAPPGLPKDIVDKLAKALSESVGDPDIREHARKNGMKLKWTGPQQFEAKLITDIKRWNDMIAEAGIKPE
jgi:tripartite-type tricarboxylate transporter receptor subunit TctC